MRSLGPVRSTLRRSPQLLVALTLLGGGLALGAGCSIGDPEPTPDGTAGSGVGGMPSGQAGSSAGGTSSAGMGPAGAGTAGSATVAGAAGSGGSGTVGGSSVGGSGAGGSSAGGSGSGGGSGGSTGSATSGCAGKSYKLCEDFESGSGTTFPMGWTKFKGYGAGAATDATISTEQFHSGKSSLKSSSMATGQGRIQKSISSLGATASKHWGRIFYRVAAPATKPSSGVLHVTFVGLLGQVENRVVDIVEDSQGKHQWLYNNPDDKGSLGSSYDWKFDDAWHCAEWNIDVGAKSYKFFHDSMEVRQIGFTGKNDAEMSNYSAIIVGATFYQMPPTAFVMWFDDLALDDNQVGCK